MKNVQITNSTINDDCFIEYALWKYKRGRFSVSFKEKELWKIASGMAIIRASDGTEEIKAGESIKFIGPKIVSVSVPDKLEVYKTYLDEEYLKKITENQQINYHIIDIIFSTLKVYEECHDELLTEGYFLREIVRCGMDGKIYKAINDGNRLMHWISLMNKKFGLSKDILLGKTRIKTGLYCTDLNFEATYGYDRTKPKSIDTIGITQEIGIVELIENPLLLDDEKNINMIDSNVYSLENLIKLKILSILKKTKLSRGLGFSFVIDEEMIPYLSKMQLPKYAKYSKKLETIILNIINARL